MNMNCTICSDPLTRTSHNIYTTPCGHIFHYCCLTRWIQKAKTCPQCRHRTTKENIHQIYINPANTDGTVDNAETLRLKLSTFQSELMLKEKYIEIYSGKYNNAKEETSKLRSVLHDLENESKISDSAVQTLKGQLEYYKVKSEESDHLCEEISNLKEKLQKFDSVLSVLNEAKEYANKMSRCNKDSESLRTLVSTLKKELIEANKKSRQASANLRHTNNRLSYYKKELSEIKQENYKLKFDAEVHKMATVPCALNSSDDKIIFTDNHRSPESHHIGKNSSVIDLTESKDDLNDLTKSKKLNGIDFASPLNKEHAEEMVKAVSPVELQDNLESVVRDNKKNFRISLRRKSSSAVSKTKFRKLAPNKRLLEYLKKSDE